MYLYGNEFRLLINKQIALAKAECYANWQEFDYWGEMVYTLTLTRTLKHGPVFKCAVYHII